jgi:hypothetical protein
MRARLMTDGYAKQAGDHYGNTETQENNQKAGKKKRDRLQ